MTDNAQSDGSQQQLTVAGPCWGTAVRFFVCVRSCGAAPPSGESAKGPRPPRGISAVRAEIWAQMRPQRTFADAAMKIKGEGPAKWYGLASVCRPTGTVHTAAAIRMRPCLEQAGCGGSRRLKPQGTPVLTRLVLCRCGGPPLQAPPPPPPQRCDVVGILLPSRSLVSR